MLSARASEEFAQRQAPQAMVVMQLWLLERRLSLGAAARGQYYLCDVNFGAPPPLGPIFHAQSALSRNRAPPPAR